MKTYTDSTLNHLSKKELIEYIRCLEHNYSIAESKFQNSLHLNTQLVKLLNKNKIEWMRVNKAGSYEIVDE